MLVGFGRGGGFLWGCRLACSCLLQNAVANLGELPCKTFLLLPHLTPLIQKEKKRPAAWLSPNNWLFISFHGTQRANPRLLEPPMQAAVGPPLNMPSPPPCTQNTLTAALWSGNAKPKEMWRRHPQSLLPGGEGREGEKSCCIWIRGTKPA